jgi:ankyrin repeat protein
MKRVVNHFIFFSLVLNICMLEAMRKRTGQEMAAESSQKAKVEEETQEQQIVQQPAAAAAAAAIVTPQVIGQFTLEGLPDELQAMILTFLAQGEGNTKLERLQNAANNIRASMSTDRRFRQFFNDAPINGRIIRLLARRYTNNNFIIAALALHTRGGMIWLLNYAQNPANIQNIRRWFPEALYFVVNTNNPQALQFLIMHFPHFVRAYLNRLYTYRLQAEEMVPHAYSRQPITLLMLAAQKGYNQIIGHLLDAGAGINFRNAERSTALMYAAYYGHTDTVELLFNRGANINARNELNHTALFLAGLEGHEDIVSMLLIAGTQLDADAEHLLTHAASEGFIGIVRLLLDYNVNFNDPDPDTPLMAAAEMGQLQPVQILLQVGANVNLHNDDEGGFTALMLAANAVFQERMNDYVEIVRLLLQAGADKDDQNEEGVTPLMLAVAEGNAEIVQILLDAEADMDIQDNDGNTALTIAQESENPNKNIIIKLLEDAMKKREGTQ